MNIMKSVRARDIRPSTHVIAWPQASRTAFSLIELMVVVGIVAILAGVLMPVIASMRTTAKQIVCVNNLRQLYLANSVYADDHDGRYVGLCSYSNGGSGAWYQLIDYRDILDIKTGISWSKKLLCPQSLGYKQPVGTMVLSYGINVCMYGSGAPVDVVADLNSGHTAPTASNPHRCYVIRSVVARPSDKLCLADGMDWWLAAWSSISYSNEMDTASVMDCAYRHRSAINVAFYDGRSLLMNRNQIDVSVGSGNEKFVGLLLDRRGVSIAVIHG